MSLLYTLDWAGRRSLRRWQIKKLKLCQNHQERTPHLLIASQCRLKACFGHACSLAHPPARPPAWPPTYGDLSQPLAPPHHRIMTPNMRALARRAAANPRAATCQRQCGRCAEGAPPHPRSYRMTPYFSPSCSTRTDHNRRRSSPEPLGGILWD